MAVCSEGARISYRELNDWANEIARLFSNAGVDANRPIALLLEHDAALIASILAVLKLGRVCVTLDLTFPDARIVSILKDSSAGVVLTDAKNLARAESLAAAEAAVMVIGGRGREPIAEIPPASFSPETFSTIVYTSGTTGRPKGVIQTHRNALRHVRAWTNGLGIFCTDRIALLASPSVGQGMNIVWAALLNGASLHPFDLKARGLNSLGEWLAGEEITVLITTPTVLRHLAALSEQGKVGGTMRLVILAGETLKGSDVAAGRQIFPPDCAFANTLSGTETGNLTQFVIRPGDPAPEGNVPVGYAAEDMNVMLQDEAGAAVSAGEIGEIMVASRYLSPGYWRNPEQTSLVFGVHPPSGLRFYRTGDVGKFSNDGCLEHLGRKDFQVKIRGHRVELAEVEAALNRLSGIREAVVVAQIDSQGETSLVACIAAGAARAPEVSALRRELEKELPLYMVPARWVVVEAIPLTPMGKLDRQALPALCENRAPPSGRTDLAGARDAMEEQIATVWGRVLQVNPVGIHDRFLELGGDSLRAAAIAAKLHAIFGVELDLAAFAEHPTVAAMSGRVKALLAASQTGGRPPVVRISREAPLVASYIQESIWQNCQTPEGMAGYTRSGVDQLRGPLNLAALQKSLDQVVRRHEILRSSFEMIDGRLMQAIHPAAAVNLPVIDLSHASDAAELATLELEEELLIRFDLGTGPLFRFKLVRLRENEHWLFRTSHYIIGDGGSWKNFFAELTKFYEAFIHDQAPPLSGEPTVQYVDYAAWQHQQFRPGSPGHAAEIGWWKRALAGAVKPSEPPLHRPAPVPDAPALEGMMDWTLERKVSHQLDLLGRKCGATYYAVRLALFSARLAIETGESHVVLGMYASNRLRPETQDMLGCFLNLATLHLVFDGSLSFSQWASAVGRTVIETQMHSEIPSELLRQELLKEGMNAPYLKVIFGFSDKRPPLRAGELEIGAIDPPRKRGKGMPWGFTTTLGSASMRESPLWWTLFDTRIYDPQKVREFIKRMQKFADEVCREPLRTMGGLEGQLFGREASGPTLTVG